VDDERRQLLTQVEIKSLIEDVVEEAVPEALTRLGFRVDDPTEAQRVMAFIRDLYGAHQTVRKHGLIAALGIVILTAASLLWIGLSSKLGGR